MAATKETAQVDVIINGTKATSTIKEMNAAVRVLNTQIANLTPGTQEFIDKVAELQRVQAKLKDTRDSVKGVSDETKGLSDRMTKLDGGGGVFSRLKNSFSETKESVLGATNGLSGFQLAMGGVIGAAVALIGYSLYSYFTKTDEGATKLQGIIGGLKAALDRLVAGFVSAGKWIVDAFSKPKEALNDIVNFIKSQVEVRIQAVGRAFQALGTILSGDLKQGFKDLTNAQIDFATGVENTTGKIAELAVEVGKAGEAAYDMAQAVDALEDAERGYSVIQNINKNQIDQLLLQSKNRLLSDQQRIDKLKEAGEIEKQDFEQRLALAQEGLRLAKEQNAIDRAASKDTDEMAQREVDAVNKILQLENESIALREKIANREAALLDSIDKDKQTKADKEKKRKEDLLKAEEKAINDAVALEKRLTALDIALIQDKYAQKEAEIIAHNQFELEELQRQGKLTTDLQDRINAEKDLKLAENEKARKQQALKDALDSEELNAQTLQAATTARFASVLGSEQAQAEAIYQIHLQSLQKELELLQLSGVAEPNEIQKKENAITLLKADAEKRRTEDLRKSSEERKRIQALELQGAKQATEGVMSLIEEVAGENAKSTVAYKAFATADAVINGILEAQRIWAQYGGIPGGQIIAGVLTGVSAARTAVAVSKINAVQAPKPKFARGGVISEGSLHSQGGIAMIDRRTGLEVGEMERNETILTGGVKANPTLLREASRINVLGGGKAFYADGGTLDAQLPSQQSNIDFSLYLQEARRTNELLSAFPTALKAYTVLTEFEDKQTLQDNIKSNANA